MSLGLNELTNVVCIEPDKNEHILFMSNCDFPYDNSLLQRLIIYLN